MPQSAGDPIVVRLSLAILRLARRLVPGGLRAQWMKEWEAEIRHRWQTMDRRRDTEWRQQASLVRRSSGAVADAAWLRQEFTLDLDVVQDARYALPLYDSDTLDSLVAESLAPRDADRSAPGVA